MAEIRIRNKGFAKCYHQYDLKLRLTDKNGRQYPLNTKYPDSTKWPAEQLSTEILRLEYREVPPGEYDLELGLFEAQTPIRLGLKQELLLADGYYRLCKLSVATL